MWKSSEWGLGTAWTGVLYMPGNKSGPNGVEKCPTAISLSCYPQMNFCSILDHGLILPLSHIAGKSSSWCVSTHGQNLSWSAAITDWTKGWFRCISRYFPRLSTLIGVVILKSSGWSVIVFIASALSNSLIGGHGNGNLNSVQPMAWLFLVSASEKTNPHLYCGTNLISSSQSSPFPSLLSNLPFPPNHIRCSSDSAGTSGDRVSSLAARADVVIATLPSSGWTNTCFPSSACIKIPPSVSIPSLGLWHCMLFFKLLVCHASRLDMWAFKISEFVCVWEEDVGTVSNPVMCLVTVSGKRTSEGQWTPTTLNQTLTLHLSPMYWIWVFQVQ